ncbi:hypothetical protein NESM_000264800 [Novymonas esmeraldas]|uniref:Uncharacterized protein n=1 Tax=Novymonas esmeraldas TaxID=1808958 RepID=A0AAW0F6Z5_9TRYP
MAGPEDTVGAYCANGAATYDGLAQALALPLIDRELHMSLFIQPLLHLHHHSSSGGTAAGSKKHSPSASAVDHHGDALVALGGTELLVKALRAHEQQTLLVMQAVALRESVVARMWRCCNAYDNGDARTDEAQFTLLRLLEEHQMVTLLAVEAVFEWRESLCRPYPFLLKRGENYLLTIAQDCTSLGATALVRSLAHVRLERDPLCAAVDLRRLLHRLDTKHRTRLVNSGAMWKVGLQPLRSIDAAQPRSAGSRGASSTGAATVQTAAAAPSSGTAGSAAVRPFADAPSDFLAEVSRLAAALHRTGGRRRSPLPPPTDAAAAEARGRSAARSPRRRPAPPPPRRGAAAEAQQHVQKQRRLAAATRVLEGEALLQRRLAEELSQLAREHNRFVPVLDVPQLFTRRGGEQVAAGVAADSWPLDPATWHALAVAERRVDRLGCMSTAREALQARQLLSAWQRRLSGNAVELTSTSSAHALAHSHSASMPGESPSASILPAAGAARSASSRYSDSFEATGNTNGSLTSGTPVEQRDHTSPPKEPLAARTTTSSSASPSSPGSPHVSVLVPDAAAAAAAGLASHSTSSDASASAPLPSSSSSSSSSVETPSRKPSLEELRRQLLEEHRLNSRSVSMLH